MRVLLIEPAKSPVSIGGEDYLLFEPLALEYIAGGVSDDHEVRILDLRLEKNLQSVLSDFRPEIVGVTAYTVHVNSVRRLCENLKRWNPDVLTVVGGHHATLLPEDFVSPAIDLVVGGEGVFAFRDIIARHADHSSFEGIPGVAYAAGGKLSCTESAFEVDLDVLPFPRRDLTAKYRRHYYSEWMKPLASIRTSKGCPHRCNFCALWKITQGQYWRRRPEKIVEELEGIEERYVFFADDESLLDTERMGRLARLIRAAGIDKQYFLYSRSDTVRRNAPLLEQWRDIGLARVFVGLEFFRNEDLSYIRKGSSIDDNEQAVKILQELDLDIYASFIVRPEFTREDFAAMKDYCRRLKLGFPSFSVLTPLPGTDLFAEVESKLLTRDYDYFDFIHTLLPTTLPLQEFYAEYSRLYQQTIPFTQMLSFLRKFSWRETPSLLVKTFRLFRRLGRVHLDYEDGKVG